MNTTSPAPAPDQKYVHAWWRQQRGRMRLQIRQLINDYYRLFPRRLERFCPVLSVHPWTQLEIGPSGVTSNGQDDDTYFPSVRWKVSGITTRRTSGGSQGKTWCWKGSYKGDEPPHIWEICRGGFTKEQSHQVREAMTCINDQVTAYQKALKHYIQALLNLKQMQVAIASMDPEAAVRLSQILGDLPPLPARYQLVGDARSNAEEEL